ncbi:hypothetical protein SAMN06295888_1131 [Desulfonatronum zhilinae]|nr:hypothetical protein SAMN06295888_1131 [Desulfonatronum zhilinae]
MGKDFQKQVREIIEERGYKLRDFLLPLFDGTDKTGTVNKTIWPTWEKYPAVKVANVVVELRKIIPIHEEFMDWTGDGEEYSPPDQIMGMRYDEVIKTIKHLSLLLSDFSNKTDRKNSLLRQDLTLGQIGCIDKKHWELLQSTCDNIKELLPELEKTEAVFNVASIGRQCRLPYRKGKGQDGICKTMKMEAARRIAELQKVVLGEPLYNVAAAIATVFVMPNLCNATVDPDSVKVRCPCKKSAAIMRPAPSDAPGRCAEGGEPEQLS